MPLGLGISCKALDLRIYGPDSWRSELRRYIQNWKGLGSNPGSWWLWVISLSNTVINIGLVTLPLDSDPKLAVGQWIAWWSVLPRGSSIRRKLVCCLIIVVMFIGLERAYRLGRGEDFEVIVLRSSRKGMGPFLWRKLTL